ncbi:MAG TPA: VCBS repeat-containing protein [Pyrinomonadaceae bacterium]|jgi:hypothetical protein
MKSFHLGTKSFVSGFVFCVLILTANQAAFSQFVCQPSGSPIVTTGSLTAADPTQAGRLVRDGRPSSCVGKTNTLQNTTAVNADSYNFNAPVTGCATAAADFTGCGVNGTTQLSAYSAYNPANPATGVIGDLGFSSTGTGSFSFPVTSGQAFTMVVNNIVGAPNTLCPSYSFTITYSTNCRQPGFDRTNDGKADITVFRGSESKWYTLNSGTFTNSVETFGLTGDIPTPGDYTGDGQTDVSVYRPSTSTWYYGNNHTNPGTNFTAQPFGVSGDVPVPGDYDRDGITDIAIWRPSNGTWYVLRSSNATLQYQQWGTNGDTPVTGDFDGDRITDYGVFRPSDPDAGGVSQFYILESNFAFGFFLRFQWGAATDRIAPGDYNGDGKTDIAMFRPSEGNWYITFPSSTQAPQIIPFGTNGDIPQPADYDGDKICDLAVFRPSVVPLQNLWYIRKSGSANAIDVVQWGVQTDQPATSPYRISNP